MSEEQARQLIHMQERFLLLANVLILAHARVALELPLAGQIAALSVCAVT